MNDISLSASKIDLGFVKVFYTCAAGAEKLGITVQRLALLLRAGRVPGAKQINARGDWRIPQAGLVKLRCELVKGPGRPRNKSA